MKHIKLKMEVPRGEAEILLHACCAPCSSAIVECLIENGVRPTIFFYNPNIFPEEEYEKRKTECIRHAKMLGLDFVDADYVHDEWLKSVQGLEGEPERGRRCMKCFVGRLEATAKYAAGNGFKVFATTLATSRWKNLEQITQAGKYAASLYPDTVFWEQNWRKGGLSERRSELIRQYEFYNQQYCGCEFSMKIMRL
ncbi:MAG: epoxyqueuosine reductase QueH [Tannerella sp.]|jgi:predicted adenine nucleotide alpha hydrolase (AANH) superfamily ATPase|nr:epoxyqueuosine reductase QueH [Tannerella sp.]